MEQLVKGTIEFLPVVIEDRLDGITTLDGHNTTYRIEDEDGTQKLAWTACNSQGMTALPLVNTTSFDKVIHRLFIKIDLAPEYPVLGPFEFEVV
jgi:hypothetical protein